MKVFFASFGGFVIVPVLCAAGLQNPSQGKPQAKPAVTTAKSPTSETEDKNPIEATPEKLAEAKKYFGYDCAMCHGPAGDGKGDLATSMKLKMNDWRDSSRLEAMSDEEIFELIVKGKGRMIGEADRYRAETVWELVNYVRTFAKKDAAAVPKAGSSQ